MRFVFPIVCLFQLILPGSVKSQISSLTELTEANRNRISELTASIRSKNKTEVARLKQLFRKAHRRFLKNYNAYATVKDVFERGDYDCLSGTYFLSASLKGLGIKHRIIETNYHIFLIAETDQGDILLESTDRYGGFISNYKKIDEKISCYRNNEVEKSNQLYLSRIRIYHEVLPSQLSGLFYFNLAIKSFHKNDLIASSQYLERAWEIYDNPRIYEFTPILIQSILQSQLDGQKKEALTQLLKSHQSQTSQTLAVR